MSELRYWMHRKSESVAMWAARHLPSGVRRWVLVNAAIRASNRDGSYPGEQTYREMYNVA